MRKNTKASLNRKLTTISVTVFVPMFLVMIYLLVSLANATDAYSKITQNIAYANQYTQDFKTRMDYSMYLAVISKKTVEELGNGDTTVNGVVTVNPYVYIEELTKACDRMSENATMSSNRNQIKRVKNSLRSLEKCVKMLEDGIKGDWTYQEKMVYLDNNIYMLTSLIREGIQDYIYVETTNYEKIRETLDARTRQSFMICSMVSILAIIVAISLTTKATRSVTIPIRNLCDMTEKVAEGDFTARTEVVNTDEIGVLSNSFNEMTAEIGTLVEDIKQKQRNLHITEIKLMQAQINPHFLYNTLDTIVWLAEQEKRDDVIKMVTALSNFFRTTLSKGRDFITVGEEESHVRSYLEIQQFRYQDILDYSIKIDDDIKEYVLPKLTLQPLVENALYHGIKNKRGKGKIEIIGHKCDEEIIIEVCDNGKGMTPDKLDDLRRNIQKKKDENMTDSFGLTNVNQRICYYYGERYGLQFESKENVGTKATLTIKAEKKQLFV
ncbi:MAG: sensor histidine kinase [Lachnospiraceae bacterium]